MKYFVTVNGRPREVELTERLGELQVKVGGRPVAVDYREVDRLGQVALLVEDRAYAVSIEGDANEAVVTIAGHLYRVELEDERERAAHAAERAAGRGGGVLNSVMPGVVVRLLVAQGETVEKGQPLLILEAMKMQNELSAPSPGTVQTIHVTEGQAVKAGAKLLTIV